MGQISRRTPSQIWPSGRRAGASWFPADAQPASSGPRFSLECDEIPPNLNLVVYDDRPIIVFPSQAQGTNKLAYQQLTDRISKNRETKVIPDSELTDPGLAAHSLLI